MSNNATAMENLITSMGNSILTPEGDDEIAYSFLGMKDSVSYFKFWQEVVEKGKLSTDGQVLLIRLAIVRKSRPRLMKLKVHTPLQGTLVRIKEASYKEVVKTLLSFTARRPIRRTNDLTRPLPR